MRNNIITTVLIISGVIVILLWYFASRPTEEELVHNLQQFYNVVDNDIQGVCFVVDKTGSDYLFYIVIKNKKIIQELKKSIINKTYIPDNPNTQFNDINRVTIETSEKKYTFVMLSDPFGRSIKENAVDIILLKEPEFDITKDYVFSKVEKSKFGDYTWYHHDQTDYQYRNDELHRFIQKYLREWISNKKVTQEGVFLDYRKKSTGISFEGIQN